MRRVVVTGLGVVSCLGIGREAVQESLRLGRSGIRFNESSAEMGLRSQVSGSVDIDLVSLIDRKLRRFMGASAGLTYVAMGQALEESGLDESVISHPRSGLVVSSAGASSANIVQGADTLRTRGVRKLGPYLVPQTMSSSVSACLATAYKIKGVNYSITSACATSAHCIGNGMELIQMGKQDVVFVGGGEEEHWTFSMMFDAMGALSTKYNDTPEKASRPYDVDRDGFVIAGGAGMLVLESLEHAEARGANILAELVGYAATSDGADMVAPSGEGAVRCMRISVEPLNGQPVDYINTHGTSTPVGDIMELDAIKEVFGEEIPPISSTKSLTGHSLGAAGVHEAIYSLLMMEGDFIAASANVDTIDPRAAGFPIVTERRDHAGLNAVMSNNFGFGGTNACLVFRRFKG